MMKIPPSSVISPKPYIAYYRDLLTNEECDFFIGNVDDFDKLRTKVNIDNTQQVDLNFTNSLSKTLSLDELKQIEFFKKISISLDLTSVTQLETIHVVKYPIGGYIVNHTDGRRTGMLRRREATLICYLNDDFTGGELYFPRLNIQIKPKRGSAVYFRYNTPELVEQLIHASNVNLIKEKYIIPIFIRSPEFVSEYQDEWKNTYNLENFNF